MNKKTDRSHKHSATTTGLSNFLDGEDAPLSVALNRGLWSIRVDRIFAVVVITNDLIGNRLTQRTIAMVA